LAAPTAHDLKLTAELEKTLHEFGLYESEEESQKREEVLGKLDVIVREWVRQVSLKKVYQSVLYNYKLGVETPLL
jgi:poly(A) polymerase